MPTPLILPPAWIASSLVTAIFALLFPVALAIIARRRLHVGWKYAGYGALIFFLFQILTRIPAVAIIGVILRPTLAGNNTAQWLWISGLALTAALFEEVGRYLGYRWFMGNEEKTWAKAVMYGIGHGGLESILLVGANGLASIFTLLAYNGLDPAKIPAVSRPTIVNAFAGIQAEPGWLQLLGGWERLWTIPAQIAFSVLVVQVFRQRSLLWLGAAIAAHFLLDFVTVILLQRFGHGQTTLLIVESLIALFGVLALFVILRLREAPAVTPPLPPSAPN